MSSYICTVPISHNNQGPSWSWSYDSWIYNYLSNQCLSPLTLWVQTPLRRGLLDTTLCDKVCHWLAAGLWFSPCTLVSFTNKTERHEIPEILLKVALSTINPPTLIITTHLRVKYFFQMSLIPVFHDTFSCHMTIFWNLLILDLYNGFCKFSTWMYLI